MEELAEISKWLLGGWLFLLFGLTLIRMLSGGIIVAGMLRTRKHAPFGFGRLQLLAVTLLFAAGYTIAALNKGPGDAMPEVPAPLLLILIGSNGTYLATKIAALRSGLRGGS